MKFARISLVFVLWTAPILAYCQIDTVQRIDQTRRNSASQQKKPYVILISVDGFRYDYATKYHAANLLRLGATGAIAADMIPSYPTQTFPNHLSIITGMYPSHHGLVDNWFYDEHLKGFYSMSNKNAVANPRWYKGTPLWVFAEEQKMLTASYYWVASETPIRNVVPTYYFPYNDITPFEKRLRAIRDWLTLPEEKRPHLITFYFPDVDHQGHYFGPDSEQTKKAVELIDDRIGQISRLTDSLMLPVNFMVVSDHGMIFSDTINTVPIPKSIIDTSVCKITSSVNIIHVYCKKKTEVKKLYQKLKDEAVGCNVYLAEETPVAWHYRKSDDRYDRIGDIIITLDTPKIFSSRKAIGYAGKHGYDPSLQKMRGIFFAWGPQIKKSGYIHSFENVNVFPLIAKILKIDYDAKSIDGDGSVLAPILK